MDKERTIAYLSMEIGIKADIPTYSGGLGVLAGDTIRAAADSNVPMTAVSLLHGKGYFHQKIGEDLRQHEEPVEWNVSGILEEMPQRASLEIEGRKVWLRAWKYEVKGAGGFTVPVYFIDSNLEENSDWDRMLTDFLYGGDDYYRICQELILGIGGLRILRALGHGHIRHFHMNEGHSAFVTVELLRERMEAVRHHSPNWEDIERVREQCIFTTHTPVPAGHDKFHAAQVEQAMGKNEAFNGIKQLFHYDGMINMTYLALNFSRYVNGVARRHGEITRIMFSGYEIDSITNGIHAAAWVSGPFEELYDEYIPGWRRNNFSLRYALSIPRQQIWLAHTRAKEALMRYVAESTGTEMDEEVLTIGFARRATEYKRADLIFFDEERLRRIAGETGPFQLIFAGKAHPRDEGGKRMINRILHFRDKLSDIIRIVYLEDYSMYIAKLMTAGSDIWLNTPRPPLEASGTSGMKAAVNGVPSLSVLDGWWMEGHIEGLTGWVIGPRRRSGGDSAEDREDANSLYEALEKKVIPIFYSERNHFISMMRHCIAINGSFFNVHRMMQEYVLNAYFH